MGFEFDFMNNFYSRPSGVSSVQVDTELESLQARTLCGGGGRGVGYLYLFYFLIFLLEE